MSLESKEKALPGYKSLADAQKEITKLQVEQNSLQVATITMLDRLCTLKERQYENDSNQYLKWRKSKRNGGLLALVHLAIVLTTLYIGAIEVNTDNALVIKITTLVNDAIGYFL